MDNNYFQVLTYFLFSLLIATGRFVHPHHQEDVAVLQHKVADLEKKVAALEKESRASKSLLRSTRPDNLESQVRQNAHHNIIAGVVGNVPYSA